MPVCRRCGKPLPAEKRNRNRICRGCDNELHRVRREANREEYNKYWRDYYHNHKDKWALGMRKWRLKAYYGLTPEEFEQIRLRQDNKCAICEDQLEPAKAYVDHNHSTGVVRGILCRRCNWALGNFRDDPALVRRALDYLLADVATAK